MTEFEMLNSIFTIEKPNDDEALVIPGDLIEVLGATVVITRILSLPQDIATRSIDEILNRFIFVGVLVDEHIHYVQTVRLRFWSVYMAMKENLYDYLGYVVDWDKLYKEQLLYKCLGLK